MHHSKRLQQQLYKHCVSDACIDFIGACLTKEASLRPDVWCLRSHRWLTMPHGCELAAKDHVSDLVLIASSIFESCFVGLCEVLNELLSTTRPPVFSPMKDEQQSQSTLLSQGARNRITRFRTNKFASQSPCTFAGSVCG